MKEYARIDLTVDAVVFGYKDNAGLSVLLIKRKKEPFKGSWALPGGFLLAHESLEDAVSRKLKHETGIDVNYLEQLYTFGDPRRDPRKRVVSVAYYGLVRPEIYELHASEDIDEVAWVKIDKLPRLAFDHKLIFEMALSRLRNKISYEPVGFELLDKAFPLTALHRLYETLYDKEIDRRNFTRKILKLNVLKELKEKTETGDKGRPGTLYEFDKEKYFKLKKKGITFEV